MPALGQKRQAMATEILTLGGVQGIAALAFGLFADKPVQGFAIEGAGEIKTLAAASRAAQDYAQWASELQRQPCQLSDPWVSTKCGESETTSDLALCPMVGNVIDKIDPLGATTCCGET